MTTGNRPVDFGRNASAFRRAPSRIGISMSFSTRSSKRGCDTRTLVFECFAKAWRACYSILIFASRRKSPQACVSFSTSCWNCAGEDESVTSSICLDNCSFICEFDRTAATDW